MKLSTVKDGELIISQNGLLIHCKNSVLSAVFGELLKLVPKDTKVKNIKKVLTERISCLIM